MNSERFMQEVEEGHKRSVNLLLKKASEYSKEGRDRLEQFHILAAQKGRSPADELTSLAGKQWTSICQMSIDPVLYSMEQWDEKLTDLRNYTHLLDALIRDLFRACGVPRMKVETK